MKKLLFVAISMIAISSSITSCSKCGHCEFTDGTKTDKVCQEGKTDLGYSLMKSSCEDGLDTRGVGQWVEN